MTAQARAFDSVGRKWLQSRGPPLAWGEVRREQKAMKSVRTREGGGGWSKVPSLGSGSSSRS